MNVNQLAHNQQMMYKFINRGVSSSDRTQLKSQLSSASSLFLQEQDSGDTVASMLQSMGISGMQGRTVREMARYQVRVQNASAKQTSGASAAEKVKQTSGRDAVSNTKQTVGKADATKAFSVRERYTPISDKATKAMQKQAIEDAKNSVKKTVAYTTDKAHGAKTGGEKPTDAAAERNKQIQEHLKEVDPSKRTAAYNTMSKVYENETDRLAKYIKEKTPGWENWGDEFDTSILDKYETGVNVFV